MDNFHPDFLHKAKVKNQKKSNKSIKNLEWVQKSEVSWLKSEDNQVIIIVGAENDQEWHIENSQLTKYSRFRV